MNCLLHDCDRMTAVVFARGYGREARGSCPQWLHDSPQYNIIVSGERILIAENSGKPLGGLGSAGTPLGELIALPRPRSWWGGCFLPLPKDPTPLSAFGLDFRSFGDGPMKNHGQARP